MYLAFWLRRSVPASLMLGRFRRPLPLLSAYPIERHSADTPTTYLEHMAWLVQFLLNNWMCEDTDGVQGGCWIVCIHTMHTNQIILHPKCKMLSLFTHPSSLLTFFLQLNKKEDILYQVRKKKILKSVNTVK